LKRSIQVSILFFLFVHSSSCTGQKNGDLLKTKPVSDSKEINSFEGPNSITRTIKIDKNGNIWFATWEGIIKYDGVSFTNMTREVSLSRFFSVLEDKEGNFWFGSIGSGVYFYNGKTFQNYTTKDGLGSDRVTHIYEDKAGNIWFGTEGGASRFDGNAFQNFTAKDGLSNNDVNVIIEDKTGRFWFGTRGETCFYDGKRFTTFTNKENKPFINVRSIIEDEKGNIWLGGNDGLWRYDQNSFKRFTNKFVGYVYEDKNGNIWTSSESAHSDGWALSRYDAKTLSDKETVVSEIMAKEGMFFGIVEDDHGNIWFGNLNGVYRYDGKVFTDFKDDK